MYTLAVAQHFVAATGSKPGTSFISASQDGSGWTIIAPQMGVSYYFAGIVALAVIASTNPKISVVK